jgi:DNA-binding HxlR family transcriptional regulator
MKLGRQQLIDLCRFGWALPILAVLGEGVAPRYHALNRNLNGASREAIADGVEHLIALRLLVKNLGNGHPLRPDFHLTEAGQEIASVARQIWTNAQSAQAEKFVRLRWGLPILNVLQAPTSFSDIKTSLPPITDRALSLILKQGQNYELIGRTVVTTAYPPATLYAPLDKAIPLCEALAA